MNLPNYFLADLPPEASLSPKMLAEACDTLKRNRSQYLEGRPTQSIIRTLAGIGRNWLDPENSFRKKALQSGNGVIEFSRPVVERGLDQFFSQLTEDNLNGLIARDLGEISRLDNFSATQAEQKQQVAAMARGPELLGQMMAGNGPTFSLTQLVLGLLTRAAQFIYCPPGTSGLLRLAAHSIYETEPKLAACLEIAEWKPGATALEETLFEAIDCLTVSGSEEFLEKIRPKIPSRVRVIRHPTLVSFGFIAHEALSGFNSQSVVARAADDIVGWDQFGWAPHVFYVQPGGAISPDQFAEKLAHELILRHGTHPPGPLSAGKKSMIETRRSFYKLRAAHSLGTRFWASEDSPGWMVVYEEDPQFQQSCLHRLIYVKPAADLESALKGADSMRGKTSTIGLASMEEKARQLATRCAQWGAHRVCAIGQMQNPPLAWRWMGRPALGDLVTWTDWEREL